MNMIYQQREIDTHKWRMEIFFFFPLKDELKILVDWKTQVDEFYGFVATCKEMEWTSKNSLVSKETNNDRLR